ncbi:MAG: hypothetical protein M4579_006902 [Chaenotheca gracillima]|nr:MAG: hypothetical protein M4579_006902 [Chaenotheca gracillima]
MYYQHAAEAPDFKRKISRATPHPYIPDAQTRIRELQNFLVPEHPGYQPEEQHENIKAAIAHYENGYDGILLVRFVHGKIVSEEYAYKGGSFTHWEEVDTLKTRYADEELLTDGRDWGTSSHRKLEEVSEQAETTRILSETPSSSLMLYVNLTSAPDDRVAGLR